MISPAQRNVGFLVAGCAFMEIMDGTIVSTSARHIGQALGVPSTAIGLVVTAYLITLAVLIPLSGWLVGRFGTRRIFLAAIVIFTLSSLLCATSSTLTELVLFRIAQGIGGAMMVPVGRLLVLGSVEKTDLMRMISFIVWPALVAPVFAPLAGGFITTYANWHWIFLINVPLGIAAFLVALRLIPRARGTKTTPLDVWGVVLTSAGLAGVTYAASVIADPAPRWGVVAAVGLPSVALLGASVRHLLNAAHPLLDLSTLRIQTFRVSVFSGAMSSMAISAVPFLLPLLFENVFGWSAVKSGALVLFVFVGNIGAKPTTAFLINRFGFRHVLVAACIVLSASIGVAGFFTRDTSLAVIVIVSVISGAARSIGGTAYNTLAFCDIPEERMSHANSMAATATQLAAGLGVAVATVALRLGEPLGTLSAGHESLASTYAAGFVLMAVLPLVALAGILRMPSHAGNAARRLASHPTTPSAPEDDTPRVAAQP